MMQLEFEYQSENKSCAFHHYALQLPFLYNTVFTQFIILLEIQDPQISINILL